MGIRFRKFQPNDYVMVIKDGNVVKRGLGLSVLYSSMRTNILVVPATAFDGAFAFDELVTSDFQTVCVQGATTYMISNYDQAIKMADFAFDSGKYERQYAAMNVLNKRINNIIKAIVIREVGKRDVRTIITLADEMAMLISNGLSEDETIKSLGIRVIAVNVLGITAKPETRKALEAAAREQILKEQDDAIYLRRNAAIEQERIIKENELNTEIRVAEKEKEKNEKEQEMMLSMQRHELAMEKEKKEKEQEIKSVALEGELELDEMAAARKIKIKQQEMEEKIKLEERNKEYVALEVENERCKAEEKAYAVAAMMKAYENVNVTLIEACALAQMDPNTLMAKAFMELGENAGKIGTLNMTPDLLETIIQKSK
ncbi:MAG: hypothetical protein IJV15_10835 [Lachnospiraceae bacterium]|nr:hypothetical protein [Lachnospiraceae bacterium]